MFANLQKILKGNRASTWCKLAEFEPWAYAQFLLPKNSLLSPFRHLSSHLCSPILEVGTQSLSPALGPSASSGDLCAGTNCGAPVPLTHRVDAVYRKPRSLSPSSPGGPWGIDGGLWSPHGYSGPADMCGAQVLWTCWVALGDRPFPPEAFQTAVLGTPKEQAPGAQGQQGTGHTALAN